MWYVRIDRTLQAYACKAGRGLGLEEHTPQPVAFYFWWEDRFQTVARA